MRKTIGLFLLCLVVASCGKSYEEQRRISRAEKARLAREDSLALKVGVVPTLDGLPLFVAKDRHFFDSLGVDVRLKAYDSHIDCDQAMSEKKVEGGMTDVVRGERMRRKGLTLRYVAATNAYWQFISNRLSRISELKQMEDKMVAMTRFSATALLTDLALDSVRMKPETVFPVQINDPNVRLHMLLNNEMDAMLATEPQATAARLMKNAVHMDSRDKDLRLGVVAFREGALRDNHRTGQLKAFVKAYNMACDSINRYGRQHYADIIKKYTKADDRTVAALPQLKFPVAAAPRQKDIDRANRWLR